MSQIKEKAKVFKDILFRIRPLPAFTPHIWQMLKVAGSIIFEKPIMKHLCGCLQKVWNHLLEQQQNWPNNIHRMPRFVSTHTRPNSIHNVHAWSLLLRRTAPHILNPVLSRSFAFNALGTSIWTFIIFEVSQACSIPVFRASFPPFCWSFCSHWTWVPNTRYPNISGTSGLAQISTLSLWQTGSYSLLVAGEEILICFWAFCSSL